MTGVVVKVGIKHALNMSSALMLMLVIALVGLTAGCGAARDAGRDGGEAERPLELTWMAILYVPDPPSRVVLDRLEELTNTRLSITWIPDAVKEDKINMALASNTLTKVVTVQDIKNSAYLKAVRSGVFWEIGPYLDEFPNLRNMSPTILHNTSTDGKIYGIYRQRELSRQGIVLRADWLDNLQLEPPATLEELYEVLRAFTYDDPDRNGLDDTFGMPDRNDLMFGVFKTLAAYHGTPNGWGLRDGQLLPDFMFDAYIDTMDFMRRLYREKLINTNFTVTSKQQQWDYFTSGQAGVYIGNMDDSRNLNNTLLQSFPEARLDLVNRIAGPDGKARVWSQAGHNGLFVFPMSEVKTEEELRRILAFFDRLGDPDIFRLTQLGLEDVHYEARDEMYYELIAEAAVARELDVRPLSALQGILPQRLKPLNDALAEKTELLNADNESFAIPNYAEALESATFNEKGDELRRIIDNATYNYILGLTDRAGFDEQIDEWLRQGGRQIIEEFNRQADGRAG